MSDPTIAAWSRENDLLFQLRQLREENERLREDKQSVDAVDTLTEEGWIWDGDQWQRPPESNQFKPDYNTEAVLVEEMQRMAKRIEELEELLTRQTARIVDLQTHIENLEGES
jgi:hypothetical protein